jgi:hypothetical protein
MYDITWFPDGGSSNPVDQLETISVDEPDSLRGVSGNNNTRARSFTLSESSTSVSLTTKNLEAGLSVISNVIQGVFAFKSDDKCLGGSGKTLTVTVESLVFAGNSLPFTVNGSTVVSKTGQASSSGNDGETNPVTYAFSV